MESCVSAPCRVHWETEPIMARMVPCDFLHPGRAGAVCLLPPCHAITMHQPAGSQGTEILPKKLFWTVQQKKNSFIIFRPQLQAVHDVWLPSPRAPSDFHIEKKTLPWFGLPRARGAVFSSSCPCQCPPCPGMGKDLALDHPWGLPGSQVEGFYLIRRIQIRRRLHQRESLHHPIMGSVKLCFSQSYPTTMGSLPFPRWGEGWLPMGSPYFRLALQAEKALSFLLCSLCFPCFKFLKLISCNCFVLFLLQQIYISGRQPWERFNPAG